MLRGPKPAMYGRGLAAFCPWEAAPQESHWAKLPPRGGGRGFRPRWQRRVGGRRDGGSRSLPPHKPYPAPVPGHLRRVPRLRPFNLEVMHAPLNTNQFLMHEKYQLMHLRSDSVGSGGSECEMDLLDMDQHLCVLENARGALLDEASPRGTCDSSPAEPTLGGFLGGFLVPELLLQEEGSLPYFPSEDDVLESEHFMERDFQDFCSKIS